jgi:glycosyltransferase involved in cell wall biosynthesis
MNLRKIKSTISAVVYKILKKIFSYLPSKIKIIIRRIVRGPNVHEILSHPNNKIAAILARVYLPKDYSHATNIISANQSIENGDIKDWLKHLNKYFNSFNLSQIILHDNKNIIDGLHSQNSAKFHNGPLVSIILPTWNSEETIIPSINSILNQSYSNIELIVIDDCSTDETWNKIVEAAKRDTRLRIYKNSVNVGPYVSRNLGINISRGEYVTCQDADDWSHPQRIEKQVDYIEKNNVNACMCGIIRMDFSGRITRINPPGPNTMDCITRSGFVSLMIKRIYLRDKIGYWDNVRFGADSELIKRTALLNQMVIPTIFSPMIICFDNPNGLTNHPIFGHNQTNGISNYRLQYAHFFKTWHTQTTKHEKLYLPFPHRPRKFKAPKACLNDDATLNKLINNHIKDYGSLGTEKIIGDVVIITNLRFPGGNASSTIDEICFFTKNNFNVKVIHCPVDNDLGKDISPRYYPYRDIIIHHSDIATIEANVLIVRHPSVAASFSFKNLSNKIRSQSAYFVINNSIKRPNGNTVYCKYKLKKNIYAIDSKTKYLAPASPLMREEIRNIGLESEFISFTAEDWTPTFKVEMYYLEPKKKLDNPVRIGRHGRDGIEKWIGDKKLLLQVYPPSEKYNVQILGGADNARKIIGQIPKNWNVYSFGELSPKEYLNNLDVFIYYPNENLVEAFGRTIVEAMIAGVPCLIPYKFQSVFGDLAIYAKPESVEIILKRLSTKDQERIKFLTEVQKIASDKYSSESILRRITCNSDDKHSKNLINEKISKSSLQYRTELMSISND